MNILIYTALLVVCISSTKLLAVTYNHQNDDNLFISYVHIDPIKGYRYDNVVDISKFGYGLDASFNGSSIALHCLGKDLKKSHFYRLNIRGNVTASGSMTTISNVQQDGNLLFATSINKNNCTYVCNYDLIQVNGNDETILYNFGKDDDLFRGSTYDPRNHIYYVCAEYNWRTIIYGIYTRDSRKVTKFGPLSDQDHYIWSILYYKSKIYAMIYNMEIGSIQLVLVDVRTKNITTIMTYKEYNAHYAFAINNNTIYSIMSSSMPNNVYFSVITNWNTKQYESIQITGRHIPINMWII